MVECRTYNQEALGSTLGQAAFKWLLLGWVTVCGQVKFIQVHNHI